MPEASGDTYTRLIRTYVQSGVIRPEDAVLVQFAGDYDVAVCQQSGLSNVTYANISSAYAGDEADRVLKLDAHQMPQADDSFDHVLAHAGLHHCSRPHQALYEMYRLARKTVLFVENQDSMLMRIATALKVVDWYELPAVIAWDYASGGVDDTGVPNHVYRWTRREVRKTVASFDPARDVPIEFHVAWNIGRERHASTVLAGKLRLSEAMAERLLGLGHRALTTVARGQGNIFAAVIRKDLAALQPWMASAESMHRNAATYA